MIRRLASAVAFLSMFAAAFYVQAADPVPKKAQATFEVRWMKSMIDHHHMAVMMADLCVERAVHPELRAACEEMAAAQTAEIEQMQVWLQTWYGIVYQPKMTLGSESMIARLAALEGESFEFAFLSLMNKHHFKAVVQSTLAVRRAFHAELKMMAADVIEAQAAEIAQFEEWLCSWYQRCDGSRLNAISQLVRHLGRRG